MRSVIIAAFVAFAITLFGTPPAIRLFRRLKAGQPIRVEGPKTHLVKQGTPTMGGAVFMFAIGVAYVVGHIVLWSLPAEPGRPRSFTITGAVLLGLMLGSGIVGFIDDFLKVRKRNSGGLKGRYKILGQIIVGAGFGYLALWFPSEGDLVPSTGEPFSTTAGSQFLSFVRDMPYIDFTKYGAIAMFVFIVMATTNGVNLTDGLDGLATGASIMVLTAYAVIAFWQYRHWCGDPATKLYCYEIRDPLEIALIAGAAAGALFGFLWWNTSPAQIIMGDTGSMALGGLIAGLALVTKTIMLLPVIGLLFVIITMSRIIQYVSFKTTGRRVFRMAPLHHHFELAGWSEVNIVIRFWIIAGIGVAIGLGLFYADFLRVVG